MRDRALLRDLLQKSPQASPRELAQATGRSMSWVKKWRKRFAEDDPQDPSVLCSRSRAHHAPYFRWDVRVTQKIVEMRFSPPENADRVCLALVPCSTSFPVTRRGLAAQTPLPRSSRTIWKILHATGCLLTRSKEPPHPNELRAPLEEIQMDARSMLVLSRLNRARKASASMSSKSAISLTQEPRLLCWPKPETISTNPPALETVSTFLQKSGLPRQMTFDRDPRWVGSVSGRDFPSPLRRLLVCLGMTPPSCPPHRPAKNAYVERYHRTSGQECFHVHHPSTLKAGTRGNGGLSPALQQRTSPRGDGPVGMSLLVWRFQTCPPSPPSASAR